MRLPPSRSFHVPIVLGLILVAAGRVQAGMVYLALGDSSTFGNDASTPSSTMPNFGDQGFVRPFADFLGTLNGGVRPDVVNLAISGELSSSLLSGVPPADWPFRRWEWNLHYPNAATSQNSLMLQTIAAAHAAGDTIGYVTLLIGANDFNHLLASPAYQAASPADQQRMFVDLLQGVLGVYGTVLTELRTLAPEARVFLPDYYNPYPASFPAHNVYEQATSAFSPLVRQTAAAFGASFVDFHGPIAGHELELTNFLLRDQHLNQAGYAVVAGQLAAAAAVPEPSSLLSLTIGGGFLLGGLALRRGLGRRATPSPRRRDIPSI